MSKQHTIARKHTRITSANRGIGRVVLRRFDPVHDSYDQLTAMLHRAFARLGMMGLNCTCVDQSSAVTRQRALAGDCFVAACDGKLLGTMTLHARDPESPCHHYHGDDVATIRQFGIDPLWQGRGLGKSLLGFAEHWAATRGYAQLALDTPYPAAHLIAFYRGQGFRIVDVMRFDGKTYDSAILGKTPIAVRTPAAWSARVS
jgi:GNAT superfamily N-acetyltransferase